MASSVLGIGCCICPPITVPNIRRGQPPIQKFIITSTRGRPSKELFHTHSISLKASRNWFSMNVAAAPISPDYFGTTSDVVSDDDDAAVLKQRSPSSSTLPSRISPWLMLPPVFEEGGNMVYKFYSLKDDKVLSINKRDPSSGGDDDGPADDLDQFIGSSHGWLVLYNYRNLDLFLSNPLSRRHIKLPPIHNLPGIPKPNLEGGFGCVDSVILSSPPDEEDCRALMIYGPEKSLAFCCPGLSSTQWTPISKHYEDPLDSYVYSSTHKLFFCINKFFDFEALDVRDPSSPKCFPVDHDMNFSKVSTPTMSEEDRFIKRFLCYYSNFLVVADHHPNSTADILLVTRHIMKEMYPCGTSGIKTLTVFDYHFGTMLPYKTIDFFVRKYNPDKKEWIYMDGSMDGLAIFVGGNHSFAMRACDFPELKPDSIYFTDLPRMIFISCDGDMCNFGGHDIGIYNYKDKTFSPCYYPCDVQSIKRIEPAPMWFTPSPL